ncbi:solute carrier family 22 member 6-A [Argonauta hians]
MSGDDECGVNFDEIYRKVGRYGKYQMKLMVQIFLNNIPAAFNIMAMIFQIHDVPFTCRTLNNNSTAEYYPRNNTESCSVTILHNDTQEGVTNRTIPCSNGYHFKYKRSSSIRSEWDLVCEHEALADLCFTIYSVGKLAGCFILLSAADRYGRKPVMIISNFCLFLINIIIIFSPSYIAFTVMKGITGFFEPGLAIPNFVLLSELFPAECRTVPQLLNGLAWSFALMILCLVAYFTEPYGWRCLNIIMAFTSCGFFFHIWTLHESLRWSVQSGNLNHAVAIIKDMCQTNKTKYSEVETLVASLYHAKSDKDIALAYLNKTSTQENSAEILRIERSDKTDNFTVSDDETYQQQQHHSTTKPLRSQKEQEIEFKHFKLPFKLPRIFSLLIIPCLRILCFIAFYMYFVCSLTYYGLYLMTSRLSGNRFLNFFLNALCETSAHIFAFTVFTRFSRKSCSMGCLTLTAVALIIAVLLRTFSDNPVAIMTSTGFSLLGTFGISAAFLLVSIYAAELFPTEVRNVGFAITNIATRAGQIIAPFSRFLSRLVPWAPGITFGVLCLFTNVLIHILPETLNKQLPQTIEDVQIRQREEAEQRIAKKIAKKQNNK